MEEKHSVLGISSFVMSIVAGLLVFICVVIAGVIEVSTPGGIDENSGTAILLGLSIIGLLIINVVALGLGIGGLVQKGRKKIFAIFGVVFSSFTILGTTFLIVLGNMG